MDCLKSFNICVNTIVLPGSIAKSSYTCEDYPVTSETDGLKLLFIPLDEDIFSQFGCSSFPKYIPALLNIGASNSGSLFCIHFHGNACDIGEVGACAISEGYTFMAHYLIVEYPKFGIAKGFSSEKVINSIAKSIHNFVTCVLNVPSDRIVIIGRSIGTGPACSLASYLESKKTPPAALILHAPYTSLRDAAYDLLGCFSYLFLNRWENWTKLCMIKDRNVVDERKRINENDNIDHDEMFSPMQSRMHENPSLKSKSISDSASKSAQRRKNNFHDPTKHHVIKCPVLFIHADNDLIIDCHHSQMMHNYRIEAGLPSEYFQQKSVPGFKKGHNYFDYSKEVVTPCRDFLQKFVPYALPHSIDLHSVLTFCTIPVDYPLSSSGGVDCVSRDRGKSISGKGDDNFRIDREPIDRDKINEKKDYGDYCPLDTHSICTYFRWTLCPCVFCCECSLACVSTGFVNVFSIFTNYSPGFVYETKKVRGVSHINGFKVMTALLCHQSLDSFIREEGPETCNDSDEDDEVDPAMVHNPLMLEMEENNKWKKTKKTIISNGNNLDPSGLELEDTSTTRSESYKKIRKMET